MKLISQQIIGNEIFSNICQPKKINEIEEINCILIYHTYYLTKPGTFLSRRTRMLSLYDSAYAQLRNHIEIVYPINDYAYDLNSNVFLISTGEYDGGRSYEGELLRWNLNTNQVNKVIEDNREFKNLKILNNIIKIDVMPKDDQVEDSSIKQYTVPILSDSAVLQDLDFEVVANAYEDSGHLDTLSNIEKTKEKFEDICSKYIDDYQHKYSANCVKFLNNNQILVGYNDGYVDKIDIINKSKVEYSISDDVHCHQILAHSKNQWLLNFFPVSPPESTTYSLDSHGNIEEIPIPDGLIYQRGNHYIIKQIVPYAEEEIHNEYLLDLNLEIIKEFTIGPYNAYQHHLELSDDNYFYFFQGIDDFKTTKELLKLSRKDKELSSVFIFDEELKIVYPNAVKIGGTIYFSCTVNNQGRANKLLSLNLFDNETIFLSDFNFPVIHLKRFTDEILLFIDVKGNFGTIALPSGKMTILNDQLDSKFQKPVSIDFNGNKLAVGYSTGTIEILDVE